MKYSEHIAPLLGLRTAQVDATIALLDDKATIPFIARYRKEKTGSLDEVQISAIAEHYTRLLELEARKETILNTIEEQGKLTPELRQQIEECWSATDLEDIYLPYKPHKKTRADIAREKGLQPLADRIRKQFPEPPSHPRSYRRPGNDIRRSVRPSPAHADPKPASRYSV